MTEQKRDFEPITTQEDFDERIKARLAREREKWEKESDTENLTAQLEAKDKEIAGLEARHAIDFELHKRGLDKLDKAERIKRQLDFDSETPITEQLQQLESDVPELFTVPRGSGSRGSAKPVLEQEKPLTREELEEMDEAAINSNWDRVKGFLAGERG